MKILSLRVKNLASLAGERLIDFENKPLKDAGLIAITGKTGAGKSTILDAMCLALFNQIPRFKHSEAKLTDADGNSISTTFTSGILRRGCVHGFAELHFQAQDQKTYAARWEVKRSHNKANGKLQAATRTLICLNDDTVLATKTTLFDQEIQRLIQLSFKQFTRAVLLAQSEVTAFLNAKDEERGELLEYLTNSEIFAKIGHLSFERTKAERLRRESLQAKIGDIDLLSEQQLLETQAQFQQAEQQDQQLSHQQRQLEKQQLWFSHQHQLEADLALKQQLVEAQQHLLHQLAPEQQQLQRLETFSSIRQTAFQQQQLLQTEAEIHPQIAQQQQLFDAFSLSFKQAEDQFQQASIDLNTQQTFDHTHSESIYQVRHCNHQRTRIGDEYKKIQTDLTALEQALIPLHQQHKESIATQNNTEQQLKNLHQTVQKTQQFSSLDRGLPAYVTQLIQFIQNYQHIEQQLGNVQQAKNQLELDQTQLKTLIRQQGNIEQLQARLAEIHLQREQLFKQKNQLDQIQQQLKNYLECKTELQQVTSKLKHAESEYQHLQQLNDQADQEFHKLKQERMQLQEILQKQRLLHTENIKQLREQLIHGEACLVCGSLSHPYKIEPQIVSTHLFELQQQQQEIAIAQENAQFDVWQETQQQLTQITTELTQYQQQQHTRTQKLSDAKHTLQQLSQTANTQLDLNQSSAQIHADLTQQQQNIQCALQQLSTDSQQWHQWIKQQQLLTQTSQTTITLLQNAQSLQAHIQAIVGCLSSVELQLWQENTITCATNILAQLQSRMQHLQEVAQLNKRLEELQQQGAALELKISYHQQRITETTLQRDELCKNGQNNTELAKTLIQNMGGSTEQTAAQWLTQLDAKRLQYQEAYQQAKQDFESSRQTFEQHKAQLEKLKTQRIHTQNQLKQLETTIHTWLQQHPTFQIEELHQLLLISPTQEQQIRQKLQEANRLLSEAQASFSTLNEQMVQHQHQQPTQSCEQLQQAITEHHACMQEHSKYRDQLKMKLELHKINFEKNQQYHDQIQQIKLEEHRWHKISSLIGDAQGKNFRDLAQQYNLDILLEYANQQLALLSQRYTLKRLNHSLSLGIIDHDMDGELRPTNSLSGGESFLTALALSLAIANMASGSTKIESLFIDEGFGTLDASSLHMVMNALDQLQSQGRKVILISHIQEMHERIPVQIQVNPLGAGASIIEFVG